ncbi:MAG: ABC transporter permease [Lachnospiraceae bacterium]|jgi:oligopeptide transport system permease protein|nr:ABC transporter permease [Lachnospiraceae bacterium]
MAKFIVKRIGYMLVTLFIVVTATFFLMHSIPGDPLAHMARNLPEQTRANYYEKYGLDKSTSEQYLIFMKNLVSKGDLGESLRYPGREVTDTLLTNASVSAQPGGMALLVGITIGILLGIVAALNKNRWPDYIVMFIAILGITVPVFVLASVLQYFLSVKLMVLPTTGWGSWKNVVLPVIVLSFGTIATYARYVKSNMLDVMGQDYILTAEAKGVSKFNVIKSHVLKNAFLPCMTLLVGQVSGIFTGSFVVEKIFGVPGLGFYYINSINDRDYTMIIGTTVFAAALFVFVQLIVDIAYSMMDPRIRVK